MAFDAFLKIEGVDGGSTAAKHKDEIEILSYSWGLSNTGASGGGGGGGAGKAVPLDFTFTHAIDKASPVLMLACATGKQYPSATFTVEKSGERQGRYIVMKLTDVLVSSMSEHGAFEGDSAEPPQEQVSLAFSKISYAVYTQSPSGQEIVTETSFDFKRQR